MIIGNIVYISNLVKTIEDKQINEIFSEFGKIENTNIIRDPFTQYILNIENVEASDL